MGSSHRLNMCLLGTQSSEWMDVDPWETLQPSYCRSLLVLRHFRESLTTNGFPNSQLLCAVPPCPPPPLPIFDVNVCPLFLSVGLLLRPCFVHAFLCLWLWLPLAHCMALSLCFSLFLSVCVCVRAFACACTCVCVYSVFVGIEYASSMPL